MRARIRHYRSADPGDRSDFPIGCRVLTQVFFRREENWLPAPKSWPIHTQTFKTFSTDTEDGRLLWEWAHSGLTPPIPGLAEETLRFGEPTLIRPRLGQGAFRVAVTDAYQRRCAVTGEEPCRFSTQRTHAPTRKEANILFRMDCYCVGTCIVYSTSGM